MKRRLLRHLRDLVGALALGGLVLITHAADSRPNIVVLVADDWGFSDVGAFGGEIATPHLDELARRGVRFSNFHVAASCAPTRSMLLTGVDNHRNGIGNLRETMPREHLGQPGYQGSLNQRVVTVASLLRDGGYRTYVTGKWNVGSEPHNLPPQRGFDRSLVQGDTGSDNWEPDKRYLPHMAKVFWFEDGKTPQMPKDFYSSEYFVDKAIDYIRSGAQSGKPFFSYIGFQANHVPVQAPKAFVDKYKGRYDQGWGALRTARRDRAAALGLVPANAPMADFATVRPWETLSAKDQQFQAREMEVYAAMAEAMDQQVGRLMDYLRQTGAYDNTVFVFLSDNGAEGSDYKEAAPWLAFNYSQDIDKLGAKGSYGIPGPGWASASVAPLHSYKFYAGEGGIRTPLIVSGVAGTVGNAVHTGLTHVTDIVPTLLELGRVAPPGATYQGQPVEPLAGRSLLPVLRQPGSSLRAGDEPLGYELSGNQALFRGDYKIVRNLPPIGDAQWHLYRLSTDPGETEDVQSRQPELFARMQADYSAWAKAHQVLPMPEGYNPVWQVVVNSFYNYWFPTYVRPMLIGLFLCAVAGLWWRQRRRAKAAQ